MQNKGTITIFAVLLALASIYQLSFTFVTSQIKKDAQAYAQGDYDKELKYLDSMSSKKVYPLLGFTFKECQQSELNLGLDLKGGMNVILEVSIPDLIVNMSENNEDPTFRKAVALAKNRQKDSQNDFISLFYEAFKEIDANAQLAAIFGTYELKDRIKPGTTDDEVLNVLREESTDAIDNSLNVLRTRIDRYGVVQPSIQKLEGNAGRIIIELPGVKDPKRVRKLLQGTANLQFWETYYYTELYNFFYQADQKLAEIKRNEKKLEQAKADTTKAVQDTTELTNLLGDTTQTSDDVLDLGNDSTDVDTPKSSQTNPLFSVLNPYTNDQRQPIKSAAVGFAHVMDTAEVNELFQIKSIKNIFPADVIFSWEVKPFEIENDKGEKEKYVKLIALKSEKRGNPSLEGDVITNAREETDNTTGEWQVSMSMNAKGTQDWARITKENVGRQIAIVLDGYVYSYPVVNSEITGGSSSISGNFLQAEAKDLANILKSGKLDAPAHIIEEEIVGPSLGQEAIESGLLSFIIAFVLILLYMVFFYKSAGLVADLALIANIFFIFGVLASLNAVLTLPGIAGIILTIGMSVDANVLIYERIKEELALGKGLKLAVADGYKNAYSAIIDANLTTLITGIILYIFGHGPIKGFATTLIIGILTSLFSAIFITRIIYTNWLKKNKEISFYTKFTKNLFKNTTYNFTKYRKIAYVISGLIIFAGVVGLVTQGLNLGVDFKGGRTYVVRFDQAVNTSDVAKSLGDVFGETPGVKTYGQSNQVKIVTKYMVDSSEENAELLAEKALFEGLRPLLADGTDLDTFLSEYRQSSRKVGPTIADDIKVAAMWAVLFSFIAIFLYVFGRFRNWQFGVGALAALVHDVLIVLGIYALLQNVMPFSMEIGQSFIAAILMVVGYSVNDTVVVFDRIREYTALNKTKERKTIFNEALNSTLSRTFNTSISTFLVMLSIFIFGGEVIRGFIFALMVGVVVGTYSSLYIATPVVFDTVKDKNVATREVKSKRDYKGGKKKKKTGKQ
ncbi:MAG: protein translocase subunit SecDF [Bacteroidota bacterium]|nr:protein translocase subunit SecDF [Bacteroidota bacterium]